MSAARLPITVALLSAILSTSPLAQAPLPTVPRTFWFTGVVRDANGEPRTGPTQLLFAIYKDADGGVPLVQELQTVTLDPDGRYGVLLGSTLPDGLPLEAFSTTEARWIGVRLADGTELPRVMLVSVPYALKAADADTLGGKPIAAFVLAEPATAASGAPVTTGRTRPLGASIPPPVSGTGTPNQVTKWLDIGGTLGDSTISEVDGKVGIGTMAPNGQLQIYGPASADVFAGMGPDLINGPAFNFGYAGSSLGRSAGFFNVRPDASAAAPNPSLRFLTGNVERMIITNNGDVGIGVTPVPGGRLQVTAGSGETAVIGISSDSLGVGVLGRSNGKGVAGLATVPGGIGVFGVGGFGGAAIEGLGGPGEPAGSFQGDVSVTGNLDVSGTVTKGGGSFKIDHPLDPENKYLSHSFVESPDMLNVYNGNVTLDAEGAAWVALPDWFETLNRDFRYQLTPIGAPANLYIAEEVAGNRFKIAGGVAGGRLSWQVTGVRQDPWANAHRIAVEEDKPETERGTYLHPDLFGQPDSRALPSAHVARERHAGAQ